MKWCTVFGCENRGQVAGVHYFKIPPHKYDSWIQVLRRDPSCGPTQPNVICSEHFGLKDFLFIGGKLHLKQNALPSYNLGGNLNAAAFGSKPSAPAPASQASVTAPASKGSVTASGSKPSVTSGSKPSVTASGSKPSVIEPPPLILNSCFNRNINTLNTLGVGTFAQTPSVTVNSSSNKSLEFPKKIGYNGSEKIHSAGPSRYIDEPLTEPPLQEKIQGTNQEEDAESISITATFNHICGLCLTQGKLENWGSEKSNTITVVINILELIFDFTVPDEVCENCFKEVKQVAIFLKKCKHSQKILKQINTECEKLQTNTDVQVQVLDSANKSKTNEQISVNESQDSVIKSPGVQKENSSIEDQFSFLQNDNLEYELLDTEEFFAQNNIDHDYMADICNPFYKNNIDKPSSNEENEINTNNTEITAYKKKNRSPKKKDADTTTKQKTPKEAYTCLCTKCGQIASSMMEHYKTSKACRPRHYKCSTCGKCFYAKALLANHMTMVHSDGPYELSMCHICSKMFKYEVNLYRHMKLHENRKQFVCEVCGKGYTTKVQFDDHKNTHTGAKPYPCGFCGKPFATRSYRGVHQNKHLKHPNRQFMSREEDFMHRREEFDPVACEICDKMFMHQRALRLHKHSHNENRTYQCSICKFIFNSRLQLHRHSSLHDEEKQFCCTLCSKRFTTALSLKCHMRRHTGERPFACPKCPKRFVQKTHLSYHMLIHAGHKSFVCHICNKSFFLKGNLTVHMRLHTGERPYECHVCGSGFRDSSMRKRHVMRQHGIDQVKFIAAVDASEL